MLAEWCEAATHKAEFVLNRISQAWSPTSWQDVTVLIAVSGGADSTALASVLVALKTCGEGQLALAHFNHRLRGTESDADEAFVRELAVKLGLSLEVGSPPHAASLPTSEEAARNARYAFFVDAAQRRGARYVATAHTADDQVETVLHRLFRGTSIGGLAGIPRIRPLSEFTTLVRPLLDVTRAEVLEYLNFIGQPFRVDSSNADGTFTRNRIRGELLPWLEEHLNPRVREAVLRLAEQSQDTAEYMRGQAAELLDRCLMSRDSGSVRLSSEALASAPLVLLRLMFVELWRRQGWPLQGMAAEEWFRLAAMVSVPMGAFQTPGNVTICRAGPLLELTRN